MVSLDATTHHSENMFQTSSNHMAICTTNRVLTQHKVREHLNHVCSSILKVQSIYMKRRRGRRLYETGRVVQMIRVGQTILRRPPLCDTRLISGQFAKAAIFRNKPVYAGRFGGPQSFFVLQYDTVTHRAFYTRHIRARNLTNQAGQIRGQTNTSYRAQSCRHEKCRMPTHIHHCAMQTIKSNNRTGRLLSKVLKKKTMHRRFSNLHTFQMI